MFEKKKSITETGVVDLRRYTPDALKKIKQIMCAGTILLPEKPSAAFMEAFSDIKITATGLIMNLAEHIELKTINGSTALTGKTDENAVYLINGMCMVYSVESAVPIKMMVNGIVIYEKGTDIDFKNINGKAISINRSLEENATYNHDIKINSSVIRNYKKDTVVSAGHNIMLTSDVTEELLAERNIYFIAGHDITCTKDIYGYIAANAAVGHKITVQNGI